MKKILRFLSFFLLFCNFSFLYGCAENIGSLPQSDASSPVTRTGFAFDTVISITIYDGQKSYVPEKCLALCEQYDALFSATREGSDVWRINHSGGSPVEVSYDTAALIQSALFYCDETDGVLDLTLLPIADEWHISEQMAQKEGNPDYEYYIPSADRLKELSEHVNYKNVTIYDETGNEIGYTDRLYKDTRYSVALSDTQSAIDLGFIAKGYIADKLKKYMLSEGVESGIISLGGNILLIGEKPVSSPFRIGIQKPFGNANEVITTVEVTDTSVVSSGCYERYFTENGTVYHHIFDTATGCPVQNDLYGVTILSDSSLQGDALSTYCYILGLDNGLAYIRSLDKVEAVFVTSDYKVVTSY